MIRVLPGEPFPADADEVVLAPGVHPGPLEIERSLLLRGEPGAVLDGGARGWTVLLQTDELKVRIEGVTVRNGHAEVGANLYVNGWSEVELVSCRFEGGRARTAGGAGAWIAAGQVSFRDCSFADNQGRWGGDLVASGAAEVSAVRCRFEGDVAAREGALLSMSACRVDGRLDLRGTTTRAPEVHLETTVVGELCNDPDLPASLSIRA